MNLYSTSFYLIIIYSCIFQLSYQKLTKHEAECELQALNVATRLADRYNSIDENTDFDTRIHHDYLVKYMGFAGWIQGGLWKNTRLTAFRNNAPEIYKVRSIESIILLCNLCFIEWWLDRESWK
jgi:hypothetical protein